MQCTIYPTLCSHKTEHTAVQRAVSVCIAVLLSALVLIFPEILLEKVARGTTVTILKYSEIIFR